MAKTVQLSTTCSDGMKVVVSHVKTRDYLGPQHSSKLLQQKHQVLQHSAAESADLVLQAVRDRVVQTSRLGKIIQTLPSLASDWLVARWTTNQRAGNCEGHLSSARTKSFTRKDEVCISDGEMSPSTRMV